MGRKWILVAALLLVGSLQAADRGLTVQVRASEDPGAPVAETVQLYGHSYALVIGIDHYSGGWPNLSMAIADADAVAQGLTAQGFEVTLVKDVTSAELHQQLKNFFAIRGDDPEARLVLWYAGHGHTINGEGFLVPADAPLATKPEFKATALHMRDFGGLVRLARAKHVLSIFDSCFSGTIFTARAGAVPAAITAKTIKPVREFLTSGDAGQQVRDDGSFRKLFLRAISGEDTVADANRDGFVTGEELALYLSQSMADLTDAAQTPKSGKLQDVDYNQGDFVFLASLSQGSTQPRFGASAPPAGLDSLSLHDLAAEQELRSKWGDWQARMADGHSQILALNAAPDLQGAAWERFLATYEQDNPYSIEDESLRADARQRRKVSSEQLALLATAKGRAARSALAACAVCPEMVLVPGGAFRMGNLAGGGEDNERPVHEVKVNAFALGKYEVTFDEYDAFARATGRNLPDDLGWGRGRRPVLMVSWEDGRAYAQWLAQTTGLRFRLPTEAEWEYAARAGSQSVYSWGDEPSPRHANGSETAGWPPDGHEAMTAPVGSYVPNAFGLYDTVGNVWEWVQDCWHANYDGAPMDGSAWNSGSCQHRVLRGGAWGYPPVWLRPAGRGWGPPTERNNSSGFRLALDL